LFVYKYKNNTMTTSVDTTLEINSEPSVQPVLQTSAPADDKKLARLLQLASARESAKSKKREREQDLSDIKSQLSTLTSALQSKTQEEKTMPAVVEKRETDEEPPTKRVRVTKEPIIDEVDSSTEKQESWSTMLLRSSALFGLGIGSWYFQHRFQRPDKQPAKKTNNMLPPPALHRRTVPAQQTKVIGKSGFFM
jgi:hypothetical protein